MVGQQLILMVTSALPPAPHVEGLEYLKIEVVVLMSGVKVPAVALKFPPVPLVRDQIPPVAGLPCNKLKRFIAAAPFDPQTVVAPSVPGLDELIILICLVVLTSVDPQGDPPVTEYFTS